MVAGITSTAEWQALRVITVCPFRPGARRITTYCGVPSDSVFTPRRISNKVGGHAAKKPRINPT